MNIVPHFPNEHGSWLTIHVFSLEFSTVSRRFRQAVTNPSVSTKHHLPLRQNMDLRRIHQGVTCRVCSWFFLGKTLGNWGYKCNLSMVIWYFNIFQAWKSWNGNNDVGKYGGDLLKWLSPLSCNQFHPLMLDFWRTTNWGILPAKTYGNLRCSFSAFFFNPRGFHPGTNAQMQPMVLEYVPT